MGGRVILIALLLWPVLALGQWQVQDAWVREAPPGSRMMAGYLVLRNAGDWPLTLTAVHSDAFQRVELHRSMHDANGMMRMQRQHAITVAPGEILRMRPGGLHLMLIGPRRPLRAGERVRFRLLSASGKAQELSAEVRRQR